MEMMEMQTSRTKFATVQTRHCTKGYFIIIIINHVIECPIPALLWCHGDVDVIMWFTVKKLIDFSIF